MTITARFPSRWSHRSVAATAVAVLVAGGASVLLGASPAGAAVSPVVPRPSGAVTADALPTAQINGVVWQQAIAGTTVYAAGKFTSARPAGSALGTGEVARNNLLSYSLTTGALTSFNPDLNVEARAVAVSPDGTRVYVGGSFTTVGGVNRSQIAAFSTSTGALITTFKPTVGNQVNAIVATNTTVYIGGLFNTVNGVTRSRLAALDVNGNLLGWNPGADSEVKAMVLSPDGSRLIVGGRFANAGGAVNKGLAALNASTGASLPFAANQAVQDYGTNSSIYSLRTDGTSIYGTGYNYHGTGTLEGSFKADPTSGDLQWVNSCHGDTYDTYPASSGVVYTVSHSHNCADLGGFGQTDTPWVAHRATAFTSAATGTLQHNYDGGNYRDWFGYPSPSIVAWSPDLTIGTASGQSQAAWTATGTSQYVVLGGEFLTVNGKAQQGLVRFAVSSIAPNAERPRLSANAFVPNLISLSPGTVRVAWQANWDRDDRTLTYKVIRNGDTANPVWTGTQDSMNWDRPMMGFTDTGLTPGGTYSYQLRVSDSTGTILGTATSITLPASGPTRDAYTQAVAADGADPLWSLGEASGTVVFDRSKFNDGVATGGVTRGVAGPVPGTTATTFDGTSGAVYSQRSSQFGPSTFSLETWFKTTTTRGGEIVGYGGKQTGLSQYVDRNLYMTNAGAVYFGVGSSKATVRSPKSGYNDGAWHHVVATETPSGGGTLYIDGVKVATNTAANAPFALYPGFWRVGGDELAGYNSAPTSDYFAGSIGQVAVYPTVLTATQVSNHYAARSSTNTPPVAAFASTMSGLDGHFDASSSTDAGGTITGYSWTFGDGTSATGKIVDHPYTSAGTYTVTLTVTATNGSDTSSQTVQAQAPNAAPTAAFSVSANGATASVDASASTDSDGTITSYAWNFGDTTTGTGKTTSHTYQNSGTYTVTLTVTDNDGGSATAQHSVTVTTPSNPPPTPAFTATASGLSVAFDGRASSDDGSVTGWAWNFGDSKTGTGSTITHVYSAAGTYNVTLTVTDNDGATSALTKSVTVGSAQVIAADAFQRALSGSWGSADTGGAWTVSGGSTNFAVGSGKGTMKMPSAGSTPSAYLNSVSAADSVSQVDVSLDKTTTGGGVFLYLDARRSGSNEYRLRAKVLETGQVQVSLLKTVGSTTTTLTTVTLAGITYTAGLVLRLKFQVTGTSTVSLAGKAWAASAAEPTAWTTTATDASSPLGAGGVGVVSYLSSSATTTPVTAAWSNLTVTAP